MKRTEIESREKMHFGCFFQGLAEKMLSWLAGSAVTHMYLCIEVFGFYSTRAVR
jgi:hypothetical protein